MSSLKPESLPNVVLRWVLGMNYQPYVHAFLYRDQFQKPSFAVHSDGYVPSGLFLKGRRAYQAVFPGACRVFFRHVRMPLRNPVENRYVFHDVPSVNSSIKNRFIIHVNNTCLCGLVYQTSFRVSTFCQAMGLMSCHIPSASTALLKRVSAVRIRPGAPDKTAGQKPFCFWPACVSPARKGAGPKARGGRLSGPGAPRWPR